MRPGVISHPGTAVDDTPGTIAVARVVANPNASRSRLRARRAIGGDLRLAQRPAEPGVAQSGNSRLLDAAGSRA
jgi:hypothetical protein